MVILTDKERYETLNVLQVLNDKGIVALDSVLSDAMNKHLIKEVEKNHPYAITPPKGENGRYQTYYKEKDGKRVILRAQTRAALIEKLIPLYVTSAYLDNFTFHDLYLEWLEVKKCNSRSMNTIKRHEQHYKKYYEPSKLHTMPVRKIDKITLEMECNRIVKEFNLSAKGWRNIRTIIKGMFDFALERNIIDKNPEPRVKITVGFRQVNKKSGSTQTYNTDELKKLNEYLDDKYSETGDVSFLAVKLNFLLGLRVSELTALKWEDITDEEAETKLHVVREEVRDQYNNITSVADHTKTHTDRFVYLIPKALEILNMINHEGEYIFMRNGERIQSRQIAYVLEKYAQRNNLEVKSTHKMRKTYASMLSAAGVPVDAIREQLGHSNLETTYSYIYNPLTEKETFNLISNAL